MPPRSPDNPFHELFPPTTSPSTPPPAPAPSIATTASDHLDDRPLPPGTAVRHLWTCHLCGCGSFRCDSSSTALCVQCAHAVCDGCTSFFGARLLDCLDAENLAGHAVPNPGCHCERPSETGRCRSHNPVRRCRAASGLRRLRHEPYARPSTVQHCVVTFRPGRDGRPALGTFFCTRPRFARPRSSRPDCVALASGPTTIVIPPVHHHHVSPPAGHDDDEEQLEEDEAPAGVPVDTGPVARFFAAGAPSVARALGLGGRPVVGVRVDPVLAFVAYYLCASFHVALAAWRRRGKGSGRAPAVSGGAGVKE